MAARLTASSPAAAASAFILRRAAKPASSTNADTEAVVRCNAVRSAVRNEVSGKSNPMNWWVRSRSPAYRATHRPLPARTAAAPATSPVRCLPVARIKAASPMSA
ncbi:hypothetical protein [Actinomadura sp. 6N118]|uniref:hypothetical protein n=1 Tax=Actinomadura sp. 6N118 TaxID=3375151 RepID=UPI0037BCBCF1